MRPSSRTLRLAFAGLAAVAVATYFLLPTGGLAQAFIYLGLLWVTAALVAARAVRERLRNAWAFLATGVLIYAVATTGWYLAPLLSAQPLPYPSIVDLTYFVAYGVFAAYLVYLLSPLRRRGLSAAGAAVDAGIVAAAGAVIVQRVLVEPLMGPSEPLGPAVLTTLGYSVALFILGVLALQLGLLRGVRSRTDALLLVWVGGEVVASFLYAHLTLDGGWYFGHLAFLPWMISYVGLGLLALEPGRDDVGARAAPPDIQTLEPQHRLILLSAAALVPVATLFGSPRADRFHETYEAWVVAVVGLVLLRGYLLMREVETERSLRRQVQALAAELEFGATHDPLTRLLNRAALTDALNRARARRARGVPGALLVLDLDGFKAVNDTLGHGVGDDALREVARRIERASRRADAVARLGGDEFAIVAEDISVPEALALADRIVAAVAEPLLEIPGRPGMGLSVGVYVLDAEDSETSALRFADAAMYMAKTAGGGIELFDRETHGPFLERHEMILHLRAASATGQLVLHYQPIVDTMHRTTRDAEALVRWRHPTRGLLGPGQFIGLAEESGVIVEVGRWVLAQACRDAAGWQGAGPDWQGVGVSVNVSRRQLRAPSIGDDVASALAGSGLSPGLLTVEVTESALMSETNEMIKVIEGLRELGVRIAMDDFGTGYSSLAQLRQLPIDVLKIDRSFVAGIAREDEEWALTAAIVKLAASLGRTTLAEGVERASQLAHLRALGVELAQGYLFARPAPLEEFLLASSRGAGAS